MSTKSPHLLSKIPSPHEATDKHSRKPNVFICFAPEDQEFARFLDQELRKHRRISGIDWEARDPAKDSTADTLRQVDTAETFLFIVSPSSIDSETCRTQIQRAIRSRKIVVPILRVDVDGASLPPALSDLRFIDFRQTVDLQKAFEEVIAAVNTNLRIDVFLCYARDDHEFVQRIYNGLEEYGKRVWMDLSSIPTSTVWEQEIYAGIEAADNFVFVISPSSVRPESFCNKELIHAAANNKRIIPLSYRSVPDSSIPPLLAQYGRLEFPDEDFEKHFAQFLSVLDEDPTYLRDHTRLLTRALEWQRSKGKEDSPDKSLLLRGTDLARAEQLLTNSADKRPNFTNLQTEYVVASRAALNRSRNNLLVGAGAVVVLMAALSVLLFVQYRIAKAATVEAQRQKGVAENEKQRAQASESDAIAARTRAETSAQAERLAKDDAERRRREAEHQRQLAVEAQQLEARAREAAEIRGLRAEAGRQELSNKPTDSLILWRTIQHLEKKAGQGSSIPELERAAHQTPLSHVLDLQQYGLGTFAISNSGKRIAVTSPNGFVRVFETSTGTMTSIDLNQKDVRTMEFSPTDDNVLITVSREYIGASVTAWNIHPKVTGRPVGKIDLYINERLKLSPNGKKAALGTNLFDLTTDKRVELRVSKENTPRKNTPRIYELAFSPDSTQLVAMFETYNSQPGLPAEYSGTIFDISNGEPLQSLQQTTEPMRLVEYSPNGRFIAAIAQNGLFRVWETKSGQLFAIPGMQTDKPRVVSQFAFAPRTTTFDLESTILVIATSNLGSDYKLSVLDLRFPDNKPEELTDHNEESVISLAFSPDGTSFASGSYERTIMVWNTKSWQHVGTLYGHQGPINKLAFINPHQLISVSQDHTVRVWSMTETLLPLALPNGRRLQSISPDGNLIAASVDSGSSVPGTEELEIFKVQPVDNQTAAPQYTVEVLRKLEGRVLTRKLERRFSYDGRRLIDIQSDQSAYVWDTVTGKRLSTLEGYSNDFAWNAGVVIATEKLSRMANFNMKHVRVKDVEKDEIILPIDLWTPKRVWDNDTRVQTIALSPDGSLLAVSYKGVGYFANPGPSGEVVALYQLNDKNKTEPKQIISSAGSLAFTNDSHYLLIGGEDNALRVWDMKTFKLMETTPSHRGAIKKIVCAHDSPTFVTISADNTAVVWSSVDFKSKQTIERGRGLSDVILSNDGSRMMTISDKASASRPFAKIVRVWETNTGNIIDTLEFDDGVNPTPAFLPEHTRAVVPRLSHLVLNGFNSDFYIWLTEPFTERLTSTAGSLTNLRVCRNTNKIVAVLPYPDPQTIWAPSKLCEGR